MSGSGEQVVYTETSNMKINGYKSPAYQFVILTPRHLLATPKLLLDANTI